MENSRLVMFLQSLVQWRRCMLIKPGEEKIRQKDILTDIGTTVIQMLKILLQVLQE